VRCRYATLQASAERGDVQTLRVFLRQFVVGDLGLQRQ
jgi:hypothetical protein